MKHTINYTVLFICLIAQLVIIDNARDEVLGLKDNIADQSRTIEALLEEFERDNRG